MMYFVLLCGGKGTRMKMDSPKQYLRVHGEYVFMYSIKALNKIKNRKKLIIAAEPKYFPLFEEQLSNLKIDYSLVPGGKTRQESVENAINSIEKINKIDTILIHDSARMFISEHTIKRILDSLKEGNTSAIPYKDSFNALYDEKSKTYIDNKHIKNIETPQGFNLSMLKEAYDNVANKDKYKDDGSIFLKRFNTLNLVYNPEYNLKITSREDILEVERHI